MEKSVLNIIWPEAEIESTEMLLCGRKHNIKRSVDGVNVEETVLEVAMPANPGPVKELLAKGVSEENLREAFSKSRSDLEWELTMFKSVRHKNLAPVEEFVIRDNITLPGWKCFIRGGKYAPLPEKIDSEKEIIRLGSELCSAVMELNKVDMIHGDIRPDNIGIDESGNYVLSGFGVRRCTESVDNRSDDGGFDAPEVRKKGKYTVASEIYSIGKTLEALCGDDLSEDVCEIIAKATMEDAAGRYSTASDMLSELTEAGTPEAELRRARRQQESREAKKAKNIEEARKALELQRAKEAEEKKKAEEERIAREARLEEEARLAEAARIAEEKKQEEMRKEAEATAAAILAEEIKKAEEKRKAEEEARLAAEAEKEAEAEAETAEEPAEDEPVAEETQEEVTEQESEEEAPAEEVSEDAEEVPAEEIAEEPVEISEEEQDVDEEPAEQIVEEAAETEENTDVLEEVQAEKEPEVIPAVPEKKKAKAWPWIVLGIVVIAAAILIWLRPWDGVLESYPSSGEDEYIGAPEEPEEDPAPIPEDVPEEEPEETPEEPQEEPVTDVYDEADITEDKEEEPVEEPTDEPVEEPADEPVENENPYAENMYDLNSSTEILTKDKLKGMNRYDSYMVINSFYARHGKIFKTASIQKYFEAQSWYTPVTRDSKEIVAEFSDIEIKNLRTVVNYQVSQGYRKAK